MKALWKDGFGGKAIRALHAFVEDTVEPLTLHQLVVAAWCKSTS